MIKLFVQKNKHNHIYNNFLSIIVNTNESISKKQVLSETVFSEGQSELAKLLESLSIQELKDIESGMIEKFEERKISNPDDYYFSKGENLVLDSVRFFVTKKENQDDEIKVGDIFHTHWGYDQTNLEYFKVVGFTKSGKSARVIQIGRKTVEGSEGFMSESCVPDPDHIVVEKECVVRIERSRKWNPIEEEHQEIGELGMRGSVWYASGHGKHLQNLYRVEGTNYRSWYA